MPPRRVRRSLAPGAASAFEADIGCRAFDRWHTRAENALPLLKDKLSAHIDDANLMSGLKQLAARLPSLKGGPLATRAARELDKLKWALPKFDEALSAIAAAGFDHCQAIIAHFRARLPADVADKHIGKAFRKAVVQVKAGTIEPQDLEDATLTALRERRLTV